MWCCYNCRMFLDEGDRALVDMALKDFSSLTPAQLTRLTSMLGTLGMYCQPNRSNIREVLTTAANSQLVDQPMPFLTLMKTGIPDVHKEIFWSVLTVQAIEYLFQMQLPTSAKVSNAIICDSDDITNEQSNSLYYLKLYVETLDQEDLETFLCFVTGSSVMPDKITVTFSNLTGEERRPIAHTCSNLLELPATYISMRDLKREFTAVLQNPLSFNMTIA